MEYKTKRALQYTMEGMEPRIMVTDPGPAFAGVATRMLWKALSQHPGALVTLPTGNTPRDIYRTLVSDYAGHQDVWQKLRYVALDDYSGLAPDDERLFANWLGRELLDPLGVPVENRITFDSSADDPAAEAARMEDRIAADGPLDIAVLGLGENGHIAFNEPGSPFDSVARLVALEPETRHANATYWGDIDHVPTHAYTLGLKTIAQAREIFLLVSGKAKADALEDMLRGPILPELPASILRTVPHVTIIADQDAMPERRKSL